MCIYREYALKSSVIIYLYWHSYLLDACRFYSCACILQLKVANKGLLELPTFIKVHIPHRFLLHMIRALWIDH